MTTSTPAHLEVPLWSIILCGVNALAFIASMALTSLGGWNDLWFGLSLFFWIMLWITVFPIMAIAFLLVIAFVFAVASSLTKERGGRMSTWLFVCGNVAFALWLISGPLITLAIGLWRIG